MSTNNTELTEATRDFAETFNRCRSELNAALEKLRAEDAVLLNRSVECQSDFTLMVRRNNFSRMNASQNDKDKK
jgi:hypothetical protein